MSNDLLDFVGALLSASPTTTHVREAVPRPARDEDRPWESGVASGAGAARGPSAEREIASLKARVTSLEQLVATLCEALVQSQQVDGPRLLARVRELAAAAEQARFEAENTAVCAGCGARLLRSEAHVRASGATLCERCHYGGQERAAPRMVEVRHEDGGYRGGRVELVEESVACARCGLTTPLSKTYRSAGGAICTPCHLSAEDES